MRNKRISIWDPNGINPYSAEVAAILLQCGCHVSRWIPRRAEGTSFAPGCTDVRVLAANRTLESLFTHVTRRLLAPVLFILLASVRRDVVVLCWVRGTFESVLFSIASFTLHRCLLVDHNPVPNRNAGASNDKIADLLRSTATSRIVHRMEFISTDDKNATYIPHPRYIVWTKQLGIDRECEAQSRNGGSDSALRVLLLGALRPDKGWMRMHELFEAVDPAHVKFVIVGTGSLPQQCREVISKRGMDVVTQISSGAVSDKTIAEAVSDCEVLVAPYVNATASGTVMLAFSVGLPTLAFRSGALADILAEEAMVNVDDYAAMAALLGRWSQIRFETYRARADDLDKEVLQRWCRVVA